MCLAGIDASDVYLGVYSARYGSDPLELSFTELEYHYAAQRGIPRLTYVLPDAGFTTIDQELKQRGFLLLARDSDLSDLPARQVPNASSLLSLIEADIEQFRRDSESESYQLRLAPSIRRLASFGGSDATCLHLALDIDLHGAADVLRSSAQHSLAEASTLGLALLQRHLRQPDWKQPGYLHDINELLKAWSYVTIWRGFKGPLGQTQVAKARLVLSEMSGDLTSGDLQKRVSELAGAVSSGLYSDRRLADASAWYDLARRHAPLPWLGGAIELARGNVPEAKRNFMDVLSQPRLSEDMKALHLAYYALCRVHEGDKLDGMHHFEEALSIQGVAATTRIRILRFLADAFDRMADLDAADEVSARAIEEASTSGVLSQVPKVEQLRRRIAFHRRGH